MKIYIAAPLACSDSANYLADLLKIQGHTIVSKWHRLVGGQMSDPVNVQERELCLSGNLFDMSFCDWVVALTNMGTPRGTLSEIGWAIGHGKRVVWVQGLDGAGANIFDVHPAVRIVRPETDGMNEIALRVGEIL